MPERLRSWLLFVPILALAVGLRLHDLDRDPPGAVAGGPTPNEGLYLLNARNQAVEGSWRLDDWNAPILNPIGSLAHAAAFESLGTGLLTARRLTAVLALAGLVLFFVLVRRAGPPGTALLAALFLASNGVHVVYSRQAGPAPIGLLLMLLTILLWDLGRRHALVTALSGVTLAAAAVVENAPHNLFFLGTAFLATLMVRLQAWKMPWAGSTRRRLRLFWGMAALATLAWALFYIRPAQDDFFRMLHTPLAESRLGNIAQNLFMAPFNFWRLIRWMPGLALIALVYFLVFARDLFAPIARHRPVSEVRIWFFAWLVAAPFYFALRWDRPLGVLVLLIPPLAVAAAEALMAVLRLTHVKKPQLDIMVVLGLLALTIWNGTQIAVHSIVSHWWNALPEGFSTHFFRLEFLIVMLVAVPLTILASHLWLRWKHFRLAVSPGLAFSLLAMGVLGVLLSDVAVGRALFRSGRDLPAAARATSDLPPGSVVAGSWAPALSLDNGHRGVVVWKGMNDRQPVARHRITHLVIQRESREFPGVNPGFGEEIGQGGRRLTLIRSFGIGAATLDLYALSAASAPPG